MIRRFLCLIGIAILLFVYTVPVFAQDANITLCSEFMYRLGTITSIASCGQYTYLLSRTSTTDQFISTFDVSDNTNPQRISSLILDTSDNALYLSLLSSGNALYAFKDTGIVILDISNPTNPVQINQFSIESPYRGAAVCGNHLLTLYTDVLSSWDMTDLSQPVLADTLHFSNAYGLILSGINAFIVRYGLPRYSVVDVSNPGNMILLGSSQGLDNGSLAAVSGNTMFKRTPATVEAYDASNLLNPAFIGYIHIGQFVTDLVMQGTRLAVKINIVSYHESDFEYKIYDVENPSNPTILYSGETRMGFDNILADNDHRMIMKTTNNFTFVDFTQPQVFGQTIGNAAISMIVANDTNAFTFNGVISSHNLSDPFFPIEEDTIDISDLTSMSISEDLLITSQCRLYNTEDDAYTSNIVKIHDISDPANILTISSFTCAGVSYPSREIRISGTKLMLVRGYKGVTVYDISNPQVPTLVLDFIDQYIHLSCVLEDGLLYSGVYNYFSGYELRVYDVGNSSPPALLSSIPVGFMINRIQKDGDLIYVGGQNQTIKIFDISNPSLPVAHGSILVGLNSNDFTIRGNALIILHNNSLSIFKIAYPLLARLIGRVNLNGYGYSLALSGHYALVGCKDFTAVYDCSTAYDECSNPTPEQNLPVPAVVLSCYPNPTPEELCIVLKLQESCAVEFSLYNVRGQKLASLQPALYKTGMNTLSLKDFTDQCPALSSGVYFIRARAGNQYASTRFVLLK